MQFSVCLLSFYSESGNMACAASLVVVPALCVEPASFSCLGVMCCCMQVEVLPHRSLLGYTRCLLCAGAHPGAAHRALQHGRHPDQPARPGGPPDRVQPGRHCTRPVRRWGGRQVGLLHTQEAVGCSSMLPCDACWADSLREPDTCHMAMSHLDNVHPVGFVVTV